MMKLVLYILVGGLCLGSLSTGMPVISSAKEITGPVASRTHVMPKQCQYGKTAATARSWRWKSGTLVEIEYAQNDFTVPETAALSRAVDNWNAALAETESRVEFIQRVDGEFLAGSGAGIIVRRGEPVVHGRVGELTFHSYSNGKVRLALTINPVVTDLEALTSLMTHELGHSLGLADCYECRRGTTAMSAFKSKNKGNDVFQPSECDRYVVATVYEKSSELADSAAEVEH